MTEGNIPKQLLLFSVPLILGNLLQQLYSTVDSIIVGNFVGSNALAAVGASSSLVYLLIAFALGAAVGAGVVVSQYLGAQDNAGVREAVHTALAISIVFGLVLTVCGIALARPLLVLMDTPAEVLDDAALYLVLCFGGIVFNVLYNMTSGILNAAGNSRRSLLYLAIASFTNIVLDIVFVAVLRMGIAGAAIATDISQLVSCVLSLAYLVRTPSAYRVSLREIHLHKKMGIRIIRIGLPTGIQNMVVSLSNVLVQAAVNQYGAAAMAGFGAYLKIDGFNILPILSISMAATTFVGQNVGAGRLDRVKKGVTLVVVMGIVYTVITGILLLRFSDPLMRLFSNEEAVIRYGEIAMRYFCPFYWVLGILHCLAGSVRGTGKTIPPMVVLLLSLCLFRIAWIQFVLPLFTDIDGIMLLYPVSWAVGAVLMVLYTWKGHWLPKTTA